MKKADIFSVGITAYELLTLEDLEKNGSEWRKFRNASYQLNSKISERETALLL